MGNNTNNWISAKPYKTMQNHANNSTSVISNKSKTTNCHKFKLSLKEKVENRYGIIFIKILRELFQKTGNCKFVYTKIKLGCKLSWKKSRNTTLHIAWNSQSRALKKPIMGRRAEGFQNVLKSAELKIKTLTSTKSQSYLLIH